MTRTQWIVVAVAAVLAAGIVAAGGVKLWRLNSVAAAARAEAAHDLAVNRAYAARQTAPTPAPEPLQARTTVEIRGETFFINGEPTYAGRTWRGRPIEGLLMNARMVQGVFDDLNPVTASDWAYPDTGVWDPERNTREFVAAMPSWRERGLLGVGVNLQGGNAHGPREGWVNTAFAADGRLHAPYFRRLRAIIEESDRLGMVVILGLFYFRNDEALEDEAAVVRAVDGAIDWLHDLGARNVLIEINNECDLWYDHAILTCDRVAELMERVRSNVRDGHAFPVSTSLTGSSVPSDDIIASSDYVLLHGNNVTEPERIAEKIATVRASPAWRAMPIVFNEDDNHGFDAHDNNFTVAAENYASWGFYDRRRSGEGFEEGFQSVPVDWTISSDRKRAFFDLLEEIVGGADD